VLDRAFGVFREGLELGPEERDRLMDMVSEDPVFTRAWRGALRNRVLPLLRILRARNRGDGAQDYIAESYALMRVLTYVADQHRIGGERVPVNIALAGPDHTDGAYVEIIDRLDGTLFVGDMAEMTAARLQPLVPQRYHMVDEEPLEYALRVMLFAHLAPLET
jgi:hypothetical protein